MYSAESFAYIGVLALDLQYLTMPHKKKKNVSFLLLKLLILNNDTA